VYQSGEPAFMSHVKAEMVRGGVQDAFGDVVVDLGIDSFITVPIEANGQRFGSFHALAVGSDKIYTERDLPFFMEVGRRMGYALQNAERFEREKRIAHAFQRAALPLDLPVVPGLVFSSLYEAGSREANVGGDFFDAFRLLDGRVIVSIGDVAGSGVSAAATMAALRQSIRAIASVNPNAEMLLRAADGVFSDAGGPLFASAFVAVFDPLTFSLEYANAGHPAPILRAPDGTTTMLGSTDLLLGLNLRNNDGSRRVYRIQTQPGSLLALYTDGLSESNYDALAGEAQILDAVRNAPQTRLGAQSAARSIRDAVLGAGGVSHDDMALLTVFLEKKIDSAAGMLSWTFNADDGTSAHAARNAVMDALRGRGVSDTDVFAAETIFSELVGNGFRHAGGEVRVALDLTQDAPVLHVLDSGPGFFLNPKLPADAFAERGRGLFIVMELAREFSVSPRTMQAGSHARAVLYGRTGPASN
jgi:anti-sigma regulatory factor (Ser/Thr protein kinase)